MLDHKPEFPCALHNWKFLLDCQMNQSVARFVHSHWSIAVEEGGLRVGQFPGGVASSVEVGFDRVEVSLGDPHAG